MLRTQVYLPNNMAEEIRKLAAHNRKSRAEVIREALAAGLSVMAIEAPRTADGLLALAKLGRELGLRGPVGLSANIDKELYGG